MTNSNTETIDFIGITHTNADLGNTYCDSNNKYPTLCYRDQFLITPIVKPKNKRGCAVLNPCKKLMIYFTKSKQP